MNAKGLATYRILVPVLLGVVAAVAAIYAGDRFWEGQAFQFRPVTSTFQLLELFMAGLLMTAANGLGLKRKQSMKRLAWMGAIVLGSAMTILQLSSQIAGGLTLFGLEESLREIANFTVGGLFSGVVAGVVAQTMQFDDLSPTVQPLGHSGEVVTTERLPDVTLRH